MVLYSTFCCDHYHAVGHASLVELGHYLLAASKFRSLFHGQCIRLVAVLHLYDVDDAFYVASLPTERGEKAQRLYNALIADGVDKALVKSYSAVEEALIESLEKTDVNDEIYVIGSFVTVTEAVKALKTIDIG